jgi:alpha-beta hydrolase superfamily lysophospholipase
MEIYRTKFKEEIIAEFVVPKKPTNKVLIICGGMPSYPAKQKYEEIMEYFANRGFWVFVPRYRGSWESYGMMFKKSPHLDIKDLIDELPKGFSNIWDAKTYRIPDPEVYLVGRSFGGPAALLNSKDARVKRVITFSSVIDWRTQEETTESIQKISWFVEVGFGAGYRIAKKGWKKIAKGKFYNPATNLKLIDGSKCLIVHAKDDTVVSVKPLQTFVEKINSKLILVEKGGHSLELFDTRFKQNWLKFVNKK